MRYGPAGFPVYGSFLAVALEAIAAPLGVSYRLCNLKECPAGVGEGASLTMDQPEFAMFA